GPPTTWRRKRGPSAFAQALRGTAFGWKGWRAAACGAVARLGTYERRREVGNVKAAPPSEVNNGRSAPAGRRLDRGNRGQHVQRQERRAHSPVAACANRETQGADLQAPRRQPQ